MQSTFPPSTAAPGAPRAVLNPGQTWILPCSPVRGRRAAAPPPPASPPPPDPTPVVPPAAGDFARQALRFPADDKQLAILNSPARRVIVNCSRQWGKSTTAAIKALHHGLSKPGSLVLLASRTLKQSGGLLQKAIGFAATLGIPHRRAPRQPESLLLPNGSQLVATSGHSDSSRGFSAVSLLIVDEAAYTPDALYHAFRPMLATQSEASVWLLSTPNGKRGFFYETWQDASPRWARFTVPATECPRISPEFLDEERRLHGPALFKQEYMCDFGASAESYFSVQALDHASQGPVIATPHVHMPPDYSRVSVMPAPGTRYYVGFDLGQRQSHSALIVLERAEVSNQKRDPVTFAWLKETYFNLKRIERFPLDMTYDDTARKIRNAVESLGTRDVSLLVDATGVGQSFLDILRKASVPGHLMPIHITAGGLPSYGNGIQRVAKVDLLRAANYLMTSDYFRIPSGLAGAADLRREMEAFHVKPSASGHHRFTSSTTDDLVMAFSLAAWQARRFIPEGAPGPPRNPGGWILNVP